MCGVNKSGAEIAATRVREQRWAAVTKVACCVGVELTISVRLFAHPTISCAHATEPRLLAVLASRKRLPVDLQAPRNAAQVITSARLGCEAPTARHAKRAICPTRASSEGGADVAKYGRECLFIRDS